MILIEYIFALIFFATTISACKSPIIDIDANVLRLAHEKCKDKTEIADYKSCMKVQNIFDEGILNNLFHCKDDKTLNFEDFVSEKCPICLRCFGKIKNDIITTRCNHKIHKACLHSWLKINSQEATKTCPLCRVHVTSDQNNEDIGRILSNKEIAFEDLLKYPLTCIESVLIEISNILTSKSYSLDETENLMKLHENLNNVKSIHEQLKMAFNEKKTEIVYEILELYPNLNLNLFEAINFGDVDLVKAFIKNGADVNDSNKLGETPLSVACFRNFPEIVNLLIQNGAIVDLIDRHNTELKMLSSLCYNGQFEIVKLLVEHCARVRELIVDPQNIVGDSPLFIACSRGHYEIAELMIGISPNGLCSIRQNKDPLRAACVNGHYKIVELLIAKSTDFKEFIDLKDSFGQTPLYNACLNGYYQIAELLIKNGADVNMMCDNKHPYLVFIGINQAAGKTPLWISCSKGRFEFVELLVNNGADVNIPDSDSIPPLSVACFNGNSEIANYLIEKGADLKSAITAKNYDGQTPLFVACKHGNIEIVKLIIENCPDKKTLIEKIDQNTEQTPLYAACVHNHLEISAFLIKNGADINVRDRTGKSIIEWASANYKFGLISFLNLN